MKKTILLILFGAFLVCYPTHKQIIASPDVNLNHEMLQILDFTGGSDVPIELRKGIPDQVAVQVEQLKLYQKIGRGELLESSPSLLVMGEIVQYDPSRKLDARSGVNGGIIVHVMFIDKQTGFNRAEFDLSGEANNNAIAREIVEFIKKNHYMK